MSGPMNDDELRNAYAPALRTPSGGRGPDCPEPEALLAAVQGAGHEAERLRILDHALGCAYCRRELALLHAVSNAAPQARSVAVRSFAWRRFLPLAAAASLLLAVGVFSVNQWRDTAGDATIRAIDAGQPALLGPAAEAAVPRGALTFVWRPVDGAFRYTLEIDAADGTLLFSAATSDTVLTARLDRIAPGRHHWLVRARMNDGSELRSETRVLELR